MLHKMNVPGKSGVAEVWASYHTGSGLWQLAWRHSMDPKKKEKCSLLNYYPPWRSWWAFAAVSQDEPATKSTNGEEGQGLSQLVSLALISVQGITLIHTHTHTNFCSTVPVIEDIKWNVLVILMIQNWKETCGKCNFLTAKSSSETNLWCYK